MVLVDYANVGYGRFSTDSQSFLYGLFCLQVEYVLNVLNIVFCFRTTRVQLNVLFMASYGKKLYDW